jgi:putative ABC transport system ATP-binding protein
MTSAVLLDEVSKRYGAGAEGMAAVAGVSLHVTPGQFVAIVGPSGCGKSTLLNLIAGIDTPSSGRVCVAGRDLAQLSDDARSELRLRHIGFVFQSFNLLPTFTAEENVALPLELARVRWRAARQQAAAALEAVGIGAAARRRRPAELSGGEQQRVAIARALVNMPHVLLADEPTGNLDSRAGTGVLDLLCTLHRERGLAILLVTHSHAAAARAQRILRMRDGRFEPESAFGTDAASEHPVSGHPGEEGGPPAGGGYTREVAIPGGNGQAH